MFQVAVIFGGFRPSQKPPSLPSLPSLLSLLEFPQVPEVGIGDAVFCGAPGEYFVEWGLEIKKWSPFKYTFIAELCDDAVGYIPTYEAFMRGGYEATPVVSVRSTPALGQMIADANFRNLRKL